MRSYALGLMVGLWLLGSVMPAWALMQTDLKILGVSRDLTRLGVVETWYQDGSGFPHCEVRLYKRGSWEAEEVRVVLPQAVDESTYMARCEALQNEVIRTADLHTVEWGLAPLSPKPPAIKDDSGHLLPNPGLGEGLPALQVYNVQLPDDEGPWQVAVNTPSSVGKEQASYRVVFRPKPEPVPVEAVTASYEPNQVLVTPIKALVNSHYGLVVLMFRDYRQGFEGYDYHYRPYFIAWPRYTVMPLDEAKAMLVKTAEFSMPESEFSLETNGFHTAYRAYLRVKAADLPVEEIQAGLNASSAAGKLYWLALLYAKDPALYRETAQALLSRSPASAEVIRMDGAAWRSVPFSDLVHEQAKGFQVAL